MDKPECGTDYLGNLYLGLIMNIASLFFVIQACGTLAAALSATNSRGLVVGHTPQTIGGNSKCDGRVWRIDVGMSSGVLHALPEVLEIVDDKVRILCAREEFHPNGEEPSEVSRWEGKMKMHDHRT